MTDPLVPTLRAAHEQGRDLVWAASLAAAWKTLGDFVGDPRVLDSPSPEAAELGRALSEETALVEPLPLNVLVTSAGVEDAAWLAATAARVRTQLGIEPSPRLLGRTPSHLVASYACLADGIAFDPPLQPGFGHLRFLGNPVRSFGLWDAPKEDAPRPGRVRQILVHHHEWVPAEEEFEGHYELDGGFEFVVELRAPDSPPNRRLLVARLYPKPTLGETVNRVLSLVKPDVLEREYCHLRPQERFEAPCVDLSLDAAFGELVGAPLIGRPEPLGTILHQVAFSLNEGGMKLRAESRYGGLSLPPRYMVCDGPSLILLTYGDRPALAVWIETPRFLIPA